MTELNEVLQTAKAAYETAENYLVETYDAIDGFIDLKYDIELNMLFDKDTDYSSQVEQCKKSIALLRKIAKVLNPIVDQLELAYTKLEENQELLKRGE